MPENDFRLPNQDGHKFDVPSKTEPVDNSVLNFLKDIQQHPKSGIAERYKRLGVSVRQGQKIKDKWIDQGLVDRYLEATETGRPKVLNLTDKGKSLLSSEHIMARKQKYRIHET